MSKHAELKIDPDATRLFTLNQNCLGILVAEGCLYEKKYFEGLGGPYYSCTGYTGDSEERKLVYYKKGETEWGERLLITDVTNYCINSALQVFPNPAANEITIRTHSGGRIQSVELVSMTGVSILKQAGIDKPEFRLNTGSMRKGVYSLTVKTKDELKNQKIIIR